MEIHEIILKPRIYFHEGKWRVKYDYTDLGFELPYNARLWAKWLWDYYIPRAEEIKTMTVRMIHA